MNLQSFINTLSDPAFWSTKKSIILSAPSMPVTFCAAIIEHLRKNASLPAEYQKLSVSSDTIEGVKSQLQMSFLGSNSWYWLGNISPERETKASGAFIEFIGSYKGPHWICSFVPSTSKYISSKACVVNLPGEVDFPTFKILADFMCPSLDERKIKVAQQLFAAKAYSLDDACMLINYLELMSTKVATESVSYLNKLFGNDENLYYLSEAFFSRDEKKFFAAWQLQAAAYPDIFWITYWSEQIWRAYNTIGYLKTKNFAQAKKASFRLPYSFLNKFWQKTSQQEMAAAYDFLYTVDYKLKTGSTFCNLELFFTSYFARKFES